MTGKTIAAVSTAPSAGGIGIVRISGDGARIIADRVFKSKNGLIADAAGYTALYGGVFDGEEKIDEAVALVFASPKSYTGEDVVELSCHGGTAVMKRVLRAVLNCGASIADAGEFTRRAFENGKMSLTQAEAVMQLISATGEQAQRAASAAKDGSLWRKLCEIRDRIIDTAAWLAAWADFPEEDIPTVQTDELTGRLENADLMIRQLIDTFDSGRADREGIDTVIVGRPNVGKSTLMNLLTGHESSIITDIPGTTRDVVSETVMLGDVRLNLSDTAGLRDTSDTVENIGVQRARKKMENAQLILAVFDRSQPLDSEDLALIEECKDKNCVAVINKSDLEDRLDEAVIKEVIADTVSISAVSEDSLTVLESAVKSAVGLRKLDPYAGILANERQLMCAVRAHDALCEAKSALAAGYTLDAVTVMCEEALAAILELSGERITDAVADSVFSKFCVGK